jgi:DNA-binding response OmpR family regulator
MEKILVIDDDPEIRKLIKDFLQKEKYTVDTAKNGNSALTMISGNPLKYRLAVLDIMLPDIAGTEVCRQIRKFSNLPIIMLTAKSEDEDKIEGLNTGADDYIAKPFNPKELVARIKALLRRSYSIPASPPVSGDRNSALQWDMDRIDHMAAYKTDIQPEKINIIFKKSESLKRVVDKLMDQISQKLGPGSTKIIQKRKVPEASCSTKIEIYPRTRKMTVDGSEARLTNKEFNIMMYFVKNKNIVISREKLLEDIWGFDFIGESRTIDVHIKELRKKIGDLNGDLIETIWSVGYKFNMDSSLNEPENENGKSK